jgi:hypothetical protein
MANFKIRSKKNVILIGIVEGFICLLSLFLIPSDPKNAWFLGYSLSRWVLIGFSIAVLLILSLELFRKKFILSHIRLILGEKTFFNLIKVSGIISGIFLWFLLSFPTSRFEYFEDFFVRLKPILIWISIMGLQSFVFLKLLNKEINTVFIRKTIKSNRKNIFLTMVLVLILFSVWIVLRNHFATALDNNLAFSGVAPITPLQMFFNIVLLALLIWFLSDKNKIKFEKIPFLVLLCIIIWGISFVTWNSQPIDCEDDRVGPFPPNYVCYPDIEDAVYSMGANYTRLGMGINNHWLTDKPLYILFLSFAQMIAGVDLDHYILVQIAVIAVSPLLCFLLGKRFLGMSGGIFLSVFMIFQGFNDLLLYREIGEVNVKMEATEGMTGLFLILFCLFLIRWFANSDDQNVAIIAGGVLGLSSLLRINPIFIIPVVVIAALFIYKRKMKKYLQMVFLFLLTFAFVFFPTILTARDENGNNYYFQKIKGVIFARYSAIDGRNYYGEEFSAKPLTKIASLEYDFNLDEEENEIGSLGKIILHTVNNYYVSIAVLPVNFQLIRADHVVEQGLWDAFHQSAFWKKEFSNENAILLILNLGMVLFGIIKSFQRWKWVGLSPLIIQTGYFLGNGIAITSGGRYLIPVIWVTYFYFSVALCIIVSMILKTFHIIKPIKTSENGELPQSALIINSGQSILVNKYIGLIAFLVVGILIPGVDWLPDQLPKEDIKDNSVIVYNLLSNQISEDQWQSFINEDNTVIVQGRAFHPKYYKKTQVSNLTNTFEVLVLGSDFAYVSNQLDVEAQKFTEDSQVILIGCIEREDTRWGAMRRIISTKALIQLDYEQNQYISPEMDWTCD